VCVCACVCVCPQYDQPDDIINLYTGIHGYMRTHLTITVPEDKFVIYSNYCIQPNHNNIAFNLCLFLHTLLHCFLHTLRVLKTFNAHRAWKESHSDSVGVGKQERALSVHPVLENNSDIFSIDDITVTCNMSPEKE